MGHLPGSRALLCRVRQPPPQAAPHPAERDATEGQAAMNATSPRTPLREDPLSLLMLVAVALLALMYWLDASQRATLEAAEQTARTAQLPPALSACAAHAVGLDGAGWQLTCPALALDVVVAAARGATPLSLPAGASSVILRAQDAVLVCPPDASAWPARCERHPIQPRAFYEEAARRRPRETQ